MLFAMHLFKLVLGFTEEQVFMIAGTGAHRQ